MAFPNDVGYFTVNTQLVPGVTYSLSSVLEYHPATRNTGDPILATGLGINRGIDYTLTGHYEAHFGYYGYNVVGISTDDWSDFGSATITLKDNFVGSTRLNGNIRTYFKNSDAGGAGWWYATGFSATVSSIYSDYSHINQNIYVALDPTNPNSFKIPTYGKYGGANYSGGRILNGTAPNFDLPPADALDATFKTHDLAYTAAENDYLMTRNERAYGQALIKADYFLLSQIKQIGADQINSDGHLYAAATEIAFVTKINRDASKYFSPEELAFYGFDKKSLGEMFTSNALMHFELSKSLQPVANHVSLNIQSFGNLSGNYLINSLEYLTKNPDLRAANVDVSDHYNKYGWREGRDPNTFFSTNGYLAANRDVKAAGVNPLDHYDQYGWKEGRDPSANFDNEQYLARNPDIRAAGIDPLTHYLAYGVDEGRQAYVAIGKASDLAVHPGFDAEYYLLSNSDVAATALIMGGNSFDFAYQHYENYGWREGRNPNAVFDSKGYLNAYGDVKAAGIDPLMHYDQYGWKEGRDPSVAFDTTAYLAANGDVAQTGVDPMQHYLQYGAVEGRSAPADTTFGFGSQG